MASTSAALRRTPLYNLHRDLGAKFLDFHGWELPIQFTSIIKEHEAVRHACGLFDVSHMGQVLIQGPGALEFVQTISCNDAARLADGGAMYSHMLNERGGVIDDVIVSRLGKDRFFIVVNASRVDKDVAWMRGHAGEGVEIVDRSPSFGMLALQGPSAAMVLAQIIPGVRELSRFGAAEYDLYGQRVLVTRTGYTGEDGFEIASPDVILARVWENLMARGASFGILPCGLGARDTLRLEAGYLLYGSDIDEEHTPLEANCAWVVKLGKKDFIGKQALEKSRREGLRRRLMGVKLLERGVPRAGCQVFLGEEAIGALSSATFSPTLQTGIGMGYLALSGSALEPGARVAVQLHGRRADAEIVAMPFYKRTN